VEQLIVKHPQHVDAIGGYYLSPAVAALVGRHLQLAQVLHRNGSSVNPQGRSGVSLLHSAAFYGDFEMVQVLLDYGVEVNAQNDFGDYPLNFALHHVKDPGVVRLLLDHGADPNSRGWEGSTPLHRASQNGRVEIARLLVEHGASVEVRDDEGRTPLDVASGEQSEEIIKLLLEHHAK
jgi:ankyrin repeat protein